MKSWKSVHVMSHVRTTTEERVSIHHREKRSTQISQGDCPWSPPQSWRSRVQGHVPWVLPHVLSRSGSGVIPLVSQVSPQILGHVDSISTCRRAARSSADLPTRCLVGALKLRLNCVSPLGRKRERERNVRCA